MSRWRRPAPDGRRVRWRVEPGSKLWHRRIRRVLEHRRSASGFWTLRASAPDAGEIIRGVDINADGETLIAAEVCMGLRVAAKSNRGPRDSAYAPLADIEALNGSASLVVKLDTNDGPRVVGIAKPRCDAANCLARIISIRRIADVSFLLVRHVGSFSWTPVEQNEPAATDFPAGERTSATQMGA